MGPETASHTEPSPLPSPTAEAAGPAKVSSSPKGEMFEWCAKHKLAPPTFQVTAVRDGFEGAAELQLPDGTKLTTNVQTARAKKLLEHAACADLLAALDRLLGPERIPPRRPSRRSRKDNTSAPAKPEETPEQARARAKALAKEQALRERQETILRLLATVTPATVRETFTVLKSRGYVRSVRIRAEQWGVVYRMEAQCVRPDGSTVHLMPFKAPSRTDGETSAMAQMLESVATCVGMRVSLLR